MSGDNQFRPWRWTTVIGILVAVISLGLCGAGGYLAWKKSSAPPSAPTPATPSKPQNASALERAASGLMSSFLRVPAQAQVSFEGKPIPAGPTANTQKKQLQTFQAWQLGKVKEGWRKGSPGKPAGTETEHFLTDAWVWWHGSPGAPDTATIQKRARTLPAADTRDPILRLTQALVLWDAQSATESLKMLTESEKGLRAGKYSLHLVFQNQFFQEQLLANMDDAKAADDMILGGLDTMAQAVQAGEFTPNEIVHAYRLISDLADYAVREDIWSMAWAIFQKRDNIDPWLRDIIIGQSEIQKAWQARGGGWANTVTPEGWRSFELHLTQARIALLDAWKRHPEWPQAAALMIKVTMGGQGEPGVSSREWFDRAVAARFDFPAAYIALLSDMQPRWHGSSEALQSFALECLNTQRFDTDVPLYYLTALRNVAGDNTHGTWRTVFRQEGVEANLDRMLEGYLKEPSGVASRPRFQAQRAIVQAWCGKYERARELLKDVPADITFQERMHRDRISWGGGDRKVFESELRAFTGPLKDTLVRAEELQLARRLEQAVDLYAQALAKSKDDPGVRAYLRDRIANIRLEDGETRNYDYYNTLRATLHRALFQNDAATVRFLIENGADPSAASDDNWIPLQIPISLGQFELVQYLVEHGANVNQTNPVRDTPLIMAIETSQPQVVEYLLAHGANINLGAKGRATPLYYAIMRNHPEIAFMLIEKGADPNVHPEDRTTPLGMAAKLGHLELVRTLLAKGADPNLPVGDNMNPLVRTARDGNVHIAALLLKNGADPNAGYRQFSALHYAAYYGHAEVARMLLAQGARSDVKDADGQTPLDAAREQKKEALIKILEQAGKKPK